MQYYEIYTFRCNGYCGKCDIVSFMKFVNVCNRTYVVVVFLVCVQLFMCVLLLHIIVSVFIVHDDIVYRYIHIFLSITTCNILQHICEMHTDILIPILLLPEKCSFKCLKINAQHWLIEIKHCSFSMSTIIVIIIIMKI